MVVQQDYRWWWKRSIELIGGVIPESFGECFTTTLKLKNCHFKVLFTPEFSRSARDLAVKKALECETPSTIQVGLDASCPLCRNISRVSNEPDIAIDYNSEYLILPNRYPSQYGVSLLLPKNHRAPSVANYSEHLTLLKATSDLSQRFGLVAVKNHPKDGMSLPKHDHVHLWPQELMCSQLILELMQSGNGSEVSIVEASMFDSRLITGVDSLEFAAGLLTKLDLLGEIYTYAQFGSSILITPRAVKSIPTLISLAGPLHLFSPPYSKNLIGALAFVPLRGGFNWDALIPAERTTKLPIAA